MKKLLISFLLVSLVLLTFIGCAAETDTAALWASATYTEDTTIGEGDITVYIDVVAGDKSITFTVNTDKNILGDALIDHQLVEGDVGAYGLYIKKVNGILADYDVDRSYWGFYQNGEYMMTGIDGTKISNGERYELVYEK